MIAPKSLLSFGNPSLRSVWSNRAHPLHSQGPQIYSTRTHVNQLSRGITFRFRNQSTLYYTLSIIVGTIAVSYSSVPFYKMICQQIGWGGQPIKFTAHSSQARGLSSRLDPVATSRRVRVTFNGSVSDVLPWKFIPRQREVRVLPGETALAFYTATNNSADDLIGVATYSVTPGQVAPYFSKIQCFCFEEQRLNAGESVDMPVFFFIDPEFANDPAMTKIDTITLSYTFFKAKNSSPSFSVGFVDPKIR